MLKGLATLLKPRSPATAAESSSGTEKHSKRRAQVQQAQKRHRAREADYIRSLESEIKTLREGIAKLNKEAASLDRRGNSLRDTLQSTLAAESVESLQESITHVVPHDLPLFPVSCELDDAIGHERFFVHESSIPVPDTVDQAFDSWAALDFILALEWPCKGHTHHAHINPAPPAPQPTIRPQDIDESMSGHAVTMSAAVLDCACDYTSSSAAAGAGAIAPESDWQISQDSIEKLIELSIRLQSDDDMVTPAQVFAIMRYQIKDPARLRSALAAFKIPLSDITQCYGFGSALPKADVFQLIADFAPT